MKADGEEGGDIHARIFILVVIPARTQTLTDSSDHAHLNSSNKRKLANLSRFFTTAAAKKFRATMHLTFRRRPSLMDPEPYPPECLSFV